MWIRGLGGEQLQWSRGNPLIINDLGSELSVLISLIRVTKRQKEVAEKRQTKNDDRNRHGRWSKDRDHL